MSAAFRMTYGRRLRSRHRCALLAVSAPRQILDYTRPCQPAALPGAGINGRRAMNLSRRDLAAAAGVLALVAAGIAGPVLANTEDEAAVKQAVEELKAAWLKQDKAKLEAMTLMHLPASFWEPRNDPEWARNPNSLQEAEVGFGLGIAGEHQLAAVGGR